MLERAEIADDAFAGVDADADPDWKKDPVGSIPLPEAVELDELAAYRLCRLNRIFDMIGIIEWRVPMPLCSRRYICRSSPSAR